MIDKDNYGVKTLRFEKIQYKDKKDYHKRSSCVIARIMVCIVKTYQ